MGRHAAAAGPGGVPGRPGAAAAAEAPAPAARAARWRHAGGAGEASAPAPPLPPPLRAAAALAGGGVALRRGAGAARRGPRRRAARGRRSQDRDRLAAEEDYDRPGRGLGGRLVEEFREQARPRLLVPATLISMSLSCLTGLRAWCSGQLLDIAIRQPPATFLDFRTIGAIYLAAALYGYFANVAQGILFALARWNMSMAMRQKLFGALLRQEIAFFESNSSGALVSRLTNDTDQLQQTLNRSPETLVVNVMRVGISLVMMAKAHALLTLVSVLPVPFALVLIKRTGRIVGKYGVMQNDALARVNAVASEAIGSARAVQLAGAEATEQRQYAGAIGTYLEVIRRTLFQETALRFMSTLVNDAFTDVPLMCLACWFISRGQLTVGQFYTYRTLLWSYRRGFRELAELFTGLSRVQAVSKRYFDIADREPLVTSAPGAARLDPRAVRGVLELEGVSFRYAGQERWAVRDANLRLRPGEVVALVGASGAGKSTLLRLCARLADPEEGAVRLDGQDLRELDLQDLRRCLGVVDQDPAMFDRTVRENIAYGAEPPSGGVEAAARDASAEAFVAALPGGYEERLGERGTRISGGQRQRLALARALVRGAPILLLDEPTSALDGETEEAVAGALAELAARGRTVLVAAHRVTTVARAHRVVVLQEGRVVEEGTRSALLARASSVYRTVVEPELGR